MSATLLEKGNQTLIAFGKHKVPLIGYCEPTLISLSDQHCEVMIPLNNKTQNHVNSLYFGTMSIGADITGGFLAMMIGEQSNHTIELLFKDFKADFIKRAMADTHFHCHDGQLIQKMIQETVQTKKRVNKTISITATTPNVTGNEVIATFELTLSLKAKTEPEN